jgi:hypothetical protein
MSSQVFGANWRETSLLLGKNLLKKTLERRS